MASELSSLRQKGILIIGSGNMVHNPSLVAWNKLSEPFGFDWAVEANEKMKTFISHDDHESLINYHHQGRPFQLSIPTPEHYLPLLYTLALKEKNDPFQFFNDQLVAGSLSMTSLKIG